MKDIPVYLFTGFLESGKSTFIQDTLSAPEIEDKDSILLLVCEEGEIEYEPDKFVPPVYIEMIEDESELTRENLRYLAKKHKIDRIFIEYNGMWKNDALFESMPRNWVIAQEMCFMNADTFEMYNLNMRQLTFDKMSTAEMLIFNRCDENTDYMSFHKEARVANRKSMIVYEYKDGKLELDQIEDPLPFDKEADFIEIEDDWYAEWYRDVNEKGDDYHGKTVKFKARAALVEDLPDGLFAIGRHVMTCCVEDIQFAGLLCVWLGSKTLKTGDWYEVEAEVKWEYTDVYREEGPVLYCKSVVSCEPANPEVATF